MRNWVERVTAAYLHACARLVIRRHAPLVVGVTGSVGKTTTKEVVAGVLMHPVARTHVGSVRKSPGNLNNTKGVPLAILGHQDWPASRFEMLRWLCALPFRTAKLLAGDYPRTLVLEYAAGPKGDIARTTALAPPTVAIVVAIGPAHLEAFGTVRRIAEEKAALVRRVPSDGLVVFGRDNPYLDDMARQTSARVVVVDGVGRALAEDIAREVGRYFGIPDDVVDDAIRNTPAVPRRLKAHTVGSLTVLDDTINANPLSMAHGLRVLGEQAASGRRRVAILGWMAELGAESPSYHREVGAFARRQADLVIGVGELATHYRPDGWFATARECGERVHALLRAGDVVLVKGSAAAAMETVVAAIRRMDDSPLASHADRHPGRVAGTAARGGQQIRRSIRR